MRSNLLRVGNDLVNQWESRLGRARVLSFPVEVTIEPTNKCNSRCVMCLPYRKDPSLPSPPLGFLEWDTLRRIEPMLRWTRGVLFCGFGEPLLHPEYLAMLRWIRERVPYVYVITNGSLIDGAMAKGLVRAGVDRVVFSMGGATDETFRKVRGVPLGPALKGVKELAKARDEAGGGLPTMEFNVVAMNSVLPELKALIDMARENGVWDVRLPQLLVESPEVSQESVFVNPGTAELLADAKGYAESVGVAFKAWDYPPKPSRCTDPYRKIFVGYNGDVMPCALERHVMGNVLEDPLVRVWRSKGYGSLRRLLLQSPAEVCPACPVWVGTPESFLNPAKHDRLGAGFFDAEGRPQGGHRELVCGGGQEVSRD